jgi:hypothetical protein
MACVEINRVSLNGRTDGRICRNLQYIFLEEVYIWIWITIMD